MQTCNLPALFVILNFMVMCLLVDTTRNLKVLFWLQKAIPLDTQKHTYYSAAYNLYITATFLLGKERVMNITIQLYVVDWRGWKRCDENLSSDHFGYSSKERKFTIFFRWRFNVTQICRLEMKLLWKSLQARSVCWSCGLNVLLVLSVVIHCMC